MLHRAGTAAIVMSVAFVCAGLLSAAESTGAMRTATPAAPGEPGSGVVELLSAPPVEGSAAAVPATIPAVFAGPAVGPPAGSSPGAANIGPNQVVLTDFKAAGNKILGKVTVDDVDREAQTFKGTSSSSAKKAAIAALPLDEMTPENRTRVEELVGSVSFFRRMPTITFSVEPEVYSFFVKHPDVAVSIWRAMKISKFEMWQTGRNDYEGDAKDGTVGTLEVLHRGVDKHVVLCEGVYKSPLLKNPIKARSLVMLQTGFSKEADGTIYVTHRADLYVSFPSQTVEMVAKILSPLAVTLTDRTFYEVSLFLKMISVAMTHRPDWVQEIATRMEGIPELRRQQFLTLTSEMYTRSQKRILETVREAALEAVEQLEAERAAGKEGRKPAANEHQGVARVRGAQAGKARTEPR